MSFFKTGNIFRVFELLKAVPIPLIIPAPGSTDTGNKNERPNCSKAETNLFFFFAITFSPFIILYIHIITDLKTIFPILSKSSFICNLLLF